jgi:isochorismate synthase
MNMGFAIWRAPGENPVGLQGEFQTADLADINVDEGFVFKPWDGQAHCYYLRGQLYSDIGLLQGWTDAIKIAEPANQQVMQPSAWQEYIDNIKRHIALGNVQKVVAARQMIGNISVSLFNAFLTACECYPEAFVSIVYQPQYGAWIGATPEILIQPRGEGWETVSMAGTLLEEGADWTGKEIDENAATQQFLEHVLNEMGAQIIESGKADVIRAGALRHLVKHYRFSLPNSNILALTARLHPTPAVGGFPRERALSIIDTYEHKNRGLFSGYLGYFRGGKPHFWVNLRCCEWQGTQAVLYAGAGINALSKADAEWAETAAKMQTIGSCL